MDVSGLARGCVVVRVSAGRELLEIIDLNMVTIPPPLTLCSLHTHTLHN